MAILLAHKGTNKERRVNGPHISGEVRKLFFFEKKNPKTFATWLRNLTQAAVSDSELEE
jgi:hypothetical protein